MIFLPEKTEIIIIILKIIPYLKLPTLVIYVLMFQMCYSNLGYLQYSKSNC